MNEEHEEHEYFVVANSFAAPIVSDRSYDYIKGKTPEDAMAEYIKTYKHPCGLFAANLYKTADAYHKGEEPLTKYRSPKVLEQTS